MPTIPPDLLPQLAQLGIVSADVSKWKRVDDWSSHFIRAHYFCPCGNRTGGEQRVELAFTWLGKRKIFIGQCRFCSTIYWRNAVSR